MAEAIAPVAQIPPGSALVVGASRGIGLGLAEELVLRGWHVVATARHPSSALDLQALHAAAAERLLIERVDITRRDEVAALRARLNEAAFDLVVLNAAIMQERHGRCETTSVEALGRLMYTNAAAPVAFARAFVDLVREPEGVLAFMSSSMGSVAENVSGGSELYRASKAALNSLTKSFVAELGSRRITVLTLHPGWVRTDLGGPDAPLDVATSVRGLAEVMFARRGSQQHVFVDYTGREIAW